ncbi:MAG: acyltransferase family protein [Bacteroidaceae bacterium]
MERKAYNHIDLLRATLILMVILVHIIHFGALYPRTREVIFVFFMPAFLLVTGYLANVRKTLQQFALYELRILLPYCIMVTAFACLSLYLPVRDGLTELSWGALLRTLCITSIGPYWFLHRMITCAMLYWLAFRLERRIGTMGAYFLLISMATLLSLFTPLLPARDAFYYIIGIGIRLFHGDLLRLFRPCSWAWIPFFMLAIWADHTRWGEIATLVYVVCFLCGMGAIGNVLPSRIYNRMGYVGRNTLPVYLFHPIFTMAAKYILPAFSFDSSGLLHTAVTLLMGTLGSLLIAWLMDRTRLSWLFARPQLLR